jgi:hypothetical protein
LTPVPVQPEEGSPSTLRLSVAGITIQVVARERDLTLVVDGTTAKFLGSAGCPDCTVTAAWSKVVRASPGELLFDAGSLWKLYRDANRVRFVFLSDAVGPLPYKEAVFDAGFTSGEIWLQQTYFDSAASVSPLEYPLDELLIQGLLVRGRGAELHACGIVDASGRGLLFVGQSGLGKTTMAMLWQNVRGARILSDDRIIVRRCGADLVMYGTPWHGEADLSEPGSAPLRGVFFLAHDLRNIVVPLKVPEATARFVASGFPPFYDREGLDFTVRFFGELAAEVPCQELRFVPDATVVRCVQAWVGTP